MPTWRCPHCGTPQTESSRCWVCRRSSTSCGTCRHYRRSVAAQLGFCGLDPRRKPLHGDEIRGCWEGAGIAAEPAPSVVAGSTPSGVDFVPVETLPVDPAPGVASEGPGRAGSYLLFEVDG